MKKYPPLTKAYKNLFDLIAKPEYEVRTVYEHYCLNKGLSNPNSTIVVLRIDVDFGFHLSDALAYHLNQRGLKASHYFLTLPEFYYDLWDSDIPSKLLSYGHEVGIHNDHLYYQLTTGKSGIERLILDIKKLSSISKSKIKGSIYHGHNKINNMGYSNWELIKDISPESIGLEYHDGFKSCYIKSSQELYEPKCDLDISDYLGLADSWGWNYVPAYPIRNIMRFSKPNNVIHICLHTHNAFKYWESWTNKYKEKMPMPDSSLEFMFKKLYLYYYFLKKKIKRLLCI